MFVVGPSKVPTTTSGMPSPLRTMPVRKVPSLQRTDPRQASGTQVHHGFLRLTKVQNNFWARAHSPRLDLGTAGHGATAGGVAEVEGVAVPVAAGGRVGARKRTEFVAVRVGHAAVVPLAAGQTRAASVGTAIIGAADVRKARNRIQTQVRRGSA